MPSQPCLPMKLVSKVPATLPADFDVPPGLPTNEDSEIIRKLEKKLLDIEKLEERLALGKEIADVQAAKIRKKNAVKMELEAARAMQAAQMQEVNSARMMQQAQTQEENLVPSVQVHIPIRLPPGLEDLTPRPLPKGASLMSLMALKKDDHDDTTTDDGSGLSEKEEDTSEDESQTSETCSLLSASAPVFEPVPQLSADAAVFEPNSKLSACAPVFDPSEQFSGNSDPVVWPPTHGKTKLSSGAKLFKPGSVAAKPNPVAKSKTKLCVGAEVFKPKVTASKPEPAAPPKTKLTCGSQLFVPQWPELSASVDMKKAGKA